MKKYIIFPFISLLLLFVFPSKAQALTCVEFFTIHYLSCESGICEGFKVEDTSAGGGCQRIPHLSSIQPNEATQVHQQLSHLSLLEQNGVWRISTYSNCADLLREGLNADPDHIKWDCGLRGDDIYVSKLADNGSTEFLQSLSAERENQARSARMYFYLSTTFWSALTLFLGAGLPLSLVVNYIKTRKGSMIPVVLFGIIFQIIFTLILYGQFAPLYRDWVEVTVYVSVLAFMVELGILTVSIIRSITQHFRKSM